MNCYQNTSSIYVYNVTRRCDKINPAFVKIMYKSIYGNSYLLCCVSYKMSLFAGKARRLKQAKEEAQDEIEKYRQEREKQFREFEAKVIVHRNAF